ncbi:hypothetical protein MPNT_560008 [Candidatus Methylacidithermus pantelleriae]|uniref:Reverse transcriptase domain-containing protein n=1 Tax=Candidatus Methylacidithermus pantelleriae TaxID=2744239 RepID=A0A8J2BLK0_9BACT|nr:hypothetical protein MPNT_560008 [Candidatus Methylacidithermus pantelleriae]
MVIDADLTEFFDGIPHAVLMKSLAGTISDGAMLAALKSLPGNLGRGARRSGKGSGGRPRPRIEGVGHHQEFLSFVFWPISLSRQFILP